MIFCLLYVILCVLNVHVVDLSNNIWGLSRGYGFVFPVLFICLVSVYLNYWFLSFFLRFTFHFSASFLMSVVISYVAKSIILWFFKYEYQLKLSVVPSFLALQLHGKNDVLTSVFSSHLIVLFWRCVLLVLILVVFFWEG